MHSSNVRTAPASLASRADRSSTVELRRDMVDLAVPIAIHPRVVIRKPSKVGRQQHTRQAKTILVWNGTLRGSFNFRCNSSLWPSYAEGTWKTVTSLDMRGGGG